MKYDTFQDSTIYVHGVCRNGLHNEHGVGFVYKKLEDYIILVTCKHSLIHNTSKEIRTRDLIETFHWDDSLVQEYIGGTNLQFKFGKKTELNVLKHYPALDEHDISFLIINQVDILEEYKRPISNKNSRCYCLQNKCKGIKKLHGTLDYNRHYRNCGMVNVDEMFDGYIVETPLENDTNENLLGIANMNEVHKGMSGSPLISENGEILGMVVAANEKERYALYYSIERIDFIYSLIEKSIINYTNLLVTN